jgi:uronate dehydrogenase
MPRILLTGAGGGVGTRLRQLLPKFYPDLRLSDIKAPADLAKSENFMAAELSDMAAVEAICDGVDGIIHLGGYSVEGPWEPIHQSNIVGSPQGRETRDLRLVQPRGWLLSAPSPDRPGCHRAS